MLDEPNKGREKLPERPSITVSDFYGQEHEDFRATARAFMDKEVKPFHDQWEKDGQVDREVWRKAGAAGLLCFDVGEEYGGAGVRDFRYNVVLTEEITRAGASGVGFPVHNDVIVPYISALANDEQKQRWLPGLVSGDLVSAIAMTEPGAGSDLQGIRTSAVDKGDHYVLNGSKTFISNGILSDLVIVVARTDADAGHQGISLLVVERGMDGFERGRNLDKIGLKAQDTSELFFDDVQVPKENLLGAEGSGFVSLMENLPQERISIAAIAVAASELVLELCLDHAKTREAFGKPIGSFQHNRFLLAEMATEVHIARVFLNDCVTRLNAGQVDTSLASMAKWWTTELQTKVVDRGVQLFGGYGYMTEYPIARAFVDSRIQTIYGGTTEIQKEIIGRMLGL
jgi:alkylation response protein AidB-like acyl-CoA dehydrogenase